MLPMSHANGDKKVVALCLHISNYLFVTIHRAKPVTEMQRQRNRGAWRSPLHHWQNQNVCSVGVVM